MMNDASKPATSNHSVASEDGGDSPRGGLPVGRIALAAVLFVVTALAFYHVWADFFRIALGDSNSSHVLFAPPAAALLFWVRRKRFREMRPRGHWVGLVLMLVAVGMFFGSGFVGMDVLFFASPIVALVGAAVCVVGVDLLTKFPAALIALLFMVPVPAIASRLISVPLQKVSAIMSEQALYLFGADVERMGNLLTVAGHDLNVAEACSGIRSISALLLLVYVSSFARPLNAPTRGLLLLLAPVIAVTTNIFRILVTSVPYQFDMVGIGEIAHEVMGWFTFAAAVLLCIGIESVLRWAELPVGKAMNLANNPASRPPWASPRALASAGAGVLAMGVLLGFTYAPTAMRSADQYHAQVRQAVESIPMHLGEWEAFPQELPQEAVEMLTPNAVYSVRYVHPDTGRSFSANIIQVYTARNMEKHTPPVCYPAHGWRQQNVTPTTFDLTNGESLETRRYTFQRSMRDGLAQIEVVHFFVLPEGEYRAVEPEIYDRAKLPWLDRFGMTQVQFVFTPSFGKDEREELISLFMEQNREVFAAIQSGINL
jgi:exosortase